MDDDYQLTEFQKNQMKAHGAIRILETMGKQSYLDESF